MQRMRITAFMRRTIAQGADKSSRGLVLAAARLMQPGQRVLVVDDNADLRGFMRELLEFAGYDVELAANGDEALERLRGRPTDIVITDIFMPDRDGLETIQAVKREYPGVRIVAITGDRLTAGDTDYLTVARIAGADGALRKPVTPEALFDALRGLSPRPRR
jgi:CheY-like chemotaxis protein